MRINPVGFGNHDNIYFTCQLQKIKFRLIGFFETGDTYILKSKKIKDIPNFNITVLIKDLKENLKELDFNLKTPDNKILKHQFKNYNNLKKYLENIKTK